MLNFDLSAISAQYRPTALWAAALLHALAQDELAGRRARRLTEPGHSTWRRFRGRLSSRDFIELLFEDAAVIHPVPFDQQVVGDPIRFDRLLETVADRWVQAVAELSATDDAAEYVDAQARLLGIQTRLARSELHVVRPHQRVLELPGTGGQLAHHLATQQRDLTLHENFTIACGSWQELTLAGAVALSQGAPHTNFVTRMAPEELATSEHPLRSRSFDFVVGLHPDKGGLLRVEDQLAIWFPTAKVLLV